MTTTPAAPIKAPKKKRADAYLVRATISLPLDMSDAESLAKAIKAVDGLAAHLPAGTQIEFASRTLGKIEAR